jgi:hypothetical protein
LVVHDHMEVIWIKLKHIPKLKTKSIKLLINVKRTIKRTRTHIVVMLMASRRIEIYN